ncbi:MAG: serine hydrolase family protein [Burkholderiaceae bacterium]|nr:serine hydrolase family protein [Burkholderiaceae bacterium]
MPDAIAPPVLILPGWQNSEPAHWQSRWEALRGYRRVEQHDWMRPLRGDWIARLEEELLACTVPALLVAHSLGCIQTAAWAAHSRNTARVRGALLVAPPDTEREDLRQLLPGWAPIARQRLPFASVVVASSDDPYGTLAHARTLAAQWGSQLHEIGARGHINAGSGLGDWPEGHDDLQRLMKDTA